MAPALWESEAKSVLSLKLGIRLRSVSSLIQQVADFFNKHVGVKRLGHVEVGTNLFATLLIELLPLCGEQDNAGVCLPPLILYGMADIEPVLLGHHDIQHDEIRLVFTDRIQCFFPVGGGDKFRPFVFKILEGLLNQHAQMGFVIDYEYFHCIHW